MRLSRSRVDGLMAVRSRAARNWLLWLVPAGVMALAHSRVHLRVRYVSGVLLGAAPGAVCGLAATVWPGGRDRAHSGG